MHACLPLFSFSDVIRWHIQLELLTEVEWLLCSVLGTQYLYLNRQTHFCLQQKQILICCRQGNNLLTPPLICISYTCHGSQPSGQQRLGYYLTE